MIFFHTLLKFKKNVFLLQDENVEDTDDNGSGVSECYNLEKIQHFSPVDDCKGGEWHG